MIGATRIVYGKTLPACSVGIRGGGWADPG